MCSIFIPWKAISNRMILLNTVHPFDNPAQTLPESLSATIGFPPRVFGKVRVLPQSVPRTYWEAPSRLPVSVRIEEFIMHPET